MCFTCRAVDFASRTPGSSGTRQERLEWLQAHHLAPCNMLCLNKNCSSFETGEMYLHEVSGACQEKKEFSVGEDVYYMGTNDRMLKVKIAEIDHSVQPKSYSIIVDGNHRDTVSERLVKIAPRVAEPRFEFQCSKCRSSRSAMGLYFKHYPDIERTMHIIYRAMQFQPRM